MRMMIDRIIMVILILLSALSISCHDTKVGNKIYSSDEIIGFQPTISPDGSWLAFTTLSHDVRPPKINLIYLQNNSSISFPQDANIQGPGAWTPDSSAIIYSISKAGNNRTEDFLAKLIIKNGGKEIISNGYKGTILIPVISKRGEILFLEYITKKEINNKEYHYSNLWYGSKNALPAKKIAEGLLSPYYSWINEDTICFSRGRKEKNNIVWTLYFKNIKSGEEKLLLKHVSDLHIVNNGSLFYFKNKDKQYEIGKILLNSLSKISITTVRDIFSPSVSPDNSKLAFIRDGQIWVLNLISLKENQLTNTKEIKKYPIWTKDGNFIIYSTLKDFIKIKSM